MEEAFKLVKEIFGDQFLIPLAIAVGIYVLFIGVSKIFETIKKFSSKKKEFEQEKNRLELLKLTLEIEALKKSHKLVEPREIQEETSSGTPEEKKLSIFKRITLHFFIFMFQWGGWNALALYVGVFMFSFYDYEPSYPMTVRVFSAMLFVVLISIGFAALGLHALERKDFFPEIPVEHIRTSKWITGVLFIAYLFFLYVKNQ